MKIGSIVRFSETFLRDIDPRSTPVGSPLCWCVGTITELEIIGELAVATVNWTVEGTGVSRHQSTRNLEVNDGLLDKLMADLLAIYADVQRSLSRIGRDF